MTRPPTGTELRPLTGYHAAARPRAADPRVGSPDPATERGDEDTERVDALDQDVLIDALIRDLADHQTEPTDTTGPAQRAVARLVRARQLVMLPGPAVALLTIERPGAHPPVTALIGNLPAAAYGDGRVRGHEGLQPDRLAAARRYVEMVRLATTPVCLAHTPHPGLADLISEVRRRPPTLVRRGPTEPQRPPVAAPPAAPRLELRVVTDPPTRAALIAASGQLGTLYLADGHHRAAAVTTADLATRARRLVLSALVPTDHLDVQAFHRRVRLADAAQHGAALLARLRAAGASLHPASASGLPALVAAARGSFGLFDGTGWWRVMVARDTDELDVEVAGRTVLTPLLGRDDLDGDPRLETVEPTVPIAALGVEGSIALWLPAPGIEVVRRVADAGEHLPAKTTYFTPKLPGGLLVEPI